MSNNVIQRFSDYWSKLNPREQRLATIVGALVLVALCAGVIRGAYGYVNNLDRTIERLSDEVVVYHRQLARKTEVEAAFSKIAMQHSSAWSESEIHDRLRQEIYRLAQKIPAPLNEEGVPVTTVTEHGELITIPQLGQGTLDEGGEGYREYTLNFRVPGEDIQDIFDYIQRLQRSPQSLRIDDFELWRDPMGSKSTANITVTRTVVDSPPEDAAPPDRGENLATLEPDLWQSEGALLEPVENDEGGDNLRIAADGGPGQAYTQQTLEPGGVYEFTLTAVASGPARLAVTDDTGQQVMPGEQTLRSDDGKPYQYTVQFTVTAREEESFRIPTVILESSDSEVVLSHLERTQLRSVEG